MFSSAKRKLIDQKMMEQHQQMQVQKELSMRQKNQKKIDPETIQRYMTAFIQMKEMENSFYLQCTQICVNLNDDLLNDKERNCLKGCNQKITKFVQIAKKQYESTQDDIKSVQNLIKLGNK